MVFVKYVLAGIIHAINFIIKALGFTIRSILFFLPDSPFRSFIESFDASMFAPLGYVLPVSQMAAVMQAWITAVAAYYLYTVILRWFKVVE